MKFADFEDILVKLGTEKIFSLKKMKKIPVLLQTDEGAKYQEFATLFNTTKASFGLEADYRQGGNFQEIRPEIQAEIIRLMLGKIAAERAANPRLGQAYDALNELCQEALQEPSVRAAFEKCIFDNTLGRPAIDAAHPQVQAKVKNLDDSAAPGTKLTTTLRYHSGVDGMQTLEHLINDISEKVRLEEAPAINLALINGNEYEWRGMNINRRPLRKNADNFKVYADALGPGLSIGGAPAQLKRSLRTTSDKFHYVFDQLQMVREQYMHANDVASLTKLDEFEKKFIDDTLIQAHKANVKSIIEAVEPYRFNYLVSSILRQAPLSPIPPAPGGDAAPSAARALYERLIQLQQRNIQPGHPAFGKSEAQRIGLLHRYLTIAAKTRDAALVNLAVPHLVRIQGRKNTEVMNKEFNLGYNFNTLPEDLQDQVRDDKTIPFKGMQSEAIQHAIHDTLDVVKLKRFASKLSRLVEGIDGKIARRIKNAADTVLQTLAEVNQVAIAAEHREANTATVNQDAIKEALKTIYKELNSISKTSTTSLRFMGQGHFFNAPNLKKTAEKQFNKLKNITSESQDIKKVEKEYSDQTDLQILKELVSYSAKRYLKAWRPHHNKDKAKDLIAIVDHIGNPALQTFSALSRPVIGGVQTDYDAVKLQRIREALLACGNGVDYVANPLLPIPYSVKKDMLFKVLADEAKGVIDDRTYGEHHGAIAHVGKRKGSNYLYSVLLAPLKLTKSMSPASREQAYYLEIYMTLTKYKEGFGRIGKPGRGKQQWAGVEGHTGLLDEVRIIHENAALSSQDKIDALSRKLMEYERNLCLDKRGLPGGDNLHTVVVNLLKKNSDIVNPSIVKNWKAESKALRSQHVKVAAEFYNRVGVPEEYRTRTFRS